MKSLITETRSELLTKIVKTLALKSHEIGEMVELYYDSQHLRIQHANKERTEPPSELAQWLDFWTHAGEAVISGALKRWIISDQSPAETKWAFDQIGIGPVIAAGLAAHIDVEKASSISSVWKFAGLAPGSDKKVKGQKLPYNSRLKTLCVRPDQLVTTRRGYLPISEIRIGDEVLTHRGRYRPVTEVICNDYQGELIGIRSYGSACRTAWVTDTHPIYVNRRATCEYYCNVRKERRFRPYDYDLKIPRISREGIAEMKLLRAGGQTLKEIGAKFGYSEGGISMLVSGKRRAKERVTGIGWVPAKAVLAGWQLFLPRLAEDSRDFNLELDTTGCVERDGLWYVQGRWEGVAAPRAQGTITKHPLTPDLARFIGLYIAEGHTNRNHVGWSFHAEETDYHEFIQETLATSFGLSSQLYRNIPNHCCQVMAGSKMLVQTFRILFGAGAANKRVPQEWLEARPEILAALVRGIFEGDGCLGETLIQLGVVSRQLAYWVIDALARLGIRASITLNNSNQRIRTTAQLVYKLTVHDHEVFMNVVFGNAKTVLANRYEPEGLWQTARFSLEQRYSGPVYNLEVAEDHSYVVEGYAVHNCWKLGESFVKVSGKEGAFYGQLYAEYKAEEIKRNEAGKYVEAAKRELASKRITEKATKERLLSGKLTDGHLHSRAKRRAVKIFLAHYWMKGREGRGLTVRDPYPITILGHDGKIPSP